MANAKKCDRCGKYYDAVDRTMHLFIGNPAYNKVADLCDRCNDELKRWYDKDLGDISDGCHTPDQAIERLKSLAEDNE